MESLVVLFNMTSVTYRKFKKNKQQQPVQLNQRLAIRPEAVHTLAHLSNNTHLDHSHTAHDYPSPWGESSINESSAFPSAFTASEYGRGVAKTAQNQLLQSVETPADEWSRHGVMKRQDSFFDSPRGENKRTVKIIPEMIFQNKEIRY